jgi:signal transduction histidine kinase
VDTNDFSNYPMMPMRKGGDSRVDALSEAVRAVTADLSLDRTLRRLAEIAAHLVNARFAALGVPNASGGLESFFVYGMTEKQIAAMDHYPLGLGLLGTLIQDNTPIRLEDMRRDPRSAGFCARHPRMTSFLGVPIISRGKQLGSLYLCDKLDELPFTEDDERMISLLAGHAAIAIENAHLSDQLRILAVVEERDRIAMELHDGIIQQIYAIGMKLEIARTTLVQNEKLDSQIMTATHDLDRVIEDLRRYIRDLKTGVDYSVSLRKQLGEVIANFGEVSKATLTTSIGQAFTLLTEGRVHSLVQIARETLSNIARHAEATAVTLRLQESGGKITLEIQDNGVGFDVSKAFDGRGLKNIQRRAEQMGAALSISSEAGAGTRLLLVLTD